MMNFYKSIIKTAKQKKLPIIITFFIFLSLFISAAILLPLNSRTIRIAQLLLHPTLENIELFKEIYGNTIEKGNFNVSISEKILENTIPQEDNIKISKFIPENLEIFISGKAGVRKDIFNNLDFKLFGTTSKKEILVKTEIEEPINNLKITGEKNDDLLKEKLSTFVENIISDLNDNSSEIHYNFIEKEEFNIQKERLSNISLSSFKFEPKINANYSDKNIKLGEISIYLGNCEKTIKESIYLSIENDVWKLDNPKTFSQRLCIQQFTSENGRKVGTCIDCTFYPANKNYGLRSDYSLKVVEFELQPNALIADFVHNDLKDLYIAARNANHNIIINSAYRSYSVQYDTFEAWVNHEMNLGSDRATAEGIANSYSALPGFSEHQLGTVVDLATPDCSGFERVCIPNQNFWKWLVDNAHLYGFVISYPEGKEHITGYVYEPWHYRWIGKDLALEFIQVRDKITLTEFLFEKNLY